MIKLKNVLEIMEATDQSGFPIPFSIEFVTCDLTKNTGGEKIRYDKAQLHIKNSTINQNPVEVNDNEKSDSKGKNPNHWMNYTRNIRAVGTNQIRKIHPLLITEFNGQKVFY